MVNKLGGPSLSQRHLNFQYRTETTEQVINLHHCTRFDAYGWTAFGNVLRKPGPGKATAEHGNELIGTLGQTKFGGNQTIG